MITFQITIHSSSLQMLLSPSDLCSLVGQKDFFFFKSKQMLGFEALCLDFLFKQKHLVRSHDESKIRIETDLKMSQIVKQICRVYIAFQMKILIKAFRICFINMKLVKITHMNTELDISADTEAKRGESKGRQ